MKTFITQLESYYKCLMTDCPANCCRYWKIEVSNDIYQNYTKLTGLHGIIIRSCIKGHGPGIIRRVFGRCPFLIEGGLCCFQKDNGDIALLPLVCKQYPFHVMDLGYRQEITILLSCPAAAATFDDHPYDINLVPTEKKYQPYYTANNDDKEFLSELLLQRDIALSAICEPSHSLPSLFQAIYAYAGRSNSLYLSNSTRVKARDIHLSFDPDDWGSYIVSKEPSNTFYPIELVDRIILDLVYYTSMSLRNPHLFVLIQKYKKLFGRLDQYSAKKWLDDRLEELYKADPSFEDRHRCYFAHTLQQLYPYAYESYFWQRQAMLAILYTELLEIFDITEFISYNRVPDKKERVLTLSALERGTRHNPALTENIFNLIRKEF